MMARVSRSFVMVMTAALLLLAAPRPVCAQWNLARRSPGQTQVYIGGGVDPAAIGTVGVAHAASLWHRTLQLRVEGNVAVGARDLADYGARMIAELSLLHHGTLRMSLTLGAVHRGTRNTIFRAHSVGGDVKSVAGIFGRRVFAAAEIGMEGAAATHFVFTERYRANYPAARDGWYTATATTARAGVIVGLSGARSELMLRSGVVRAPGGAPLIPPVYLSLGIGRRF